VRDNSSLGDDKSIVDDYSQSLNSANSELNSGSQSVFLFRVNIQRGDFLKGKFALCCKNYNDALFFFIRAAKKKSIVLDGLIQKKSLKHIKKIVIKLKKKLEKEGLFDKSHKKAIPQYPKRIGVVTAATGAAIRDIITTIKKRYPICEILVLPTLVQGDHAKEQIVKQIKNAQNYDINTLIVGRGGGSIEDLWPFNEEIVAREIYACKIPVISAVGHEVDFTISDFVADARAPTPTGAAQIAVPDINEVKFKVNNLKDKLTKNITNKVGENKLILKHLSEKQVLKNPEEIYEIKEMHLDNLLNKLNYTSKNIITKNQQRLFKLENAPILKNPQNMLNKKKEKYYKNVNKLEVLNPLLTLKRGYSIAKSEGKVISSAKDAKSGDKIDIEFDDGIINTRVI
jgi:exodeoxyribonuclease VII large subunit